MKRKDIIILMGFALLILLLQQCKKDDPRIDTVDYSYFPLETGRYIIYDIEEINVDVIAGYYDTLCYTIKEIITDTFYDMENRLSYRVERYKRTNDSAGWEIKDVWYANYTATTAERTEENIRYIKLAFPVELNKTWDGDAYNTLDPYDEYEYEITALDVPDTVNEVYFDSVLTVLQKDRESLIDKYYAVEKYAKNIGMIYKKDMEIYSQTITGDPIEERIERGTIFTQKIVSYGSE